MRDSDNSLLHHISVSHCESAVVETASESGIGTFLDSEFSMTYADVMVRPHTPPNQIRLRSPMRDDNDAIYHCHSGGFRNHGNKVATIVNHTSDGEMEGEDDDDDEEMREMLFTPFKIDVVGGMLGDLSPDVDHLSSSVVAGSDSWISFTPLSSVGRTIARTSTPCQMLDQMTPPKAGASIGEGQCSTDLRCAAGGQRCRPSPGLSRLLQEFDDDEGIFANGDTSLGDLATAAGAFILDEGVGLDVSLDF
jgi:hypothetical protein